MSIHYEDKSGLFTLQTAHSTYQFKIGKLLALEHQYYGKSIPEEDLSSLLPYYPRSFSPNPYETGTDASYSYDVIMQECPYYGSGDFRDGCVEITAQNGAKGLDLRYQSHNVKKGKYQLDSLPAVYSKESDHAETLEVVLLDELSGLEVTLLYGVLEEYDIITRACRFRNTKEELLNLNRALSCCLDFQDSRWELLSFYGRHTGERIPQRQPLRHGKTVIDSLRGASSHQQNPFVILCEAAATEERGECYGMSFVYSGNFIFSAEVDQFDQTRLLMGVHPHGFGFCLAPGEVFTAPEVILSYSSEGLGKLSRNFHKIIRHRLCRGRYQLSRRPVLINNWEATYFQFDEKKLLSIAETAAELGIEMLVIDDGWFGKREDDHSGLGDWVVNENKLKGGLLQLSEKVSQLGLKLGIWFEPEMVSEDSDLYRTHPEYCLQIPGRKGHLSRYQFVLDFSRSDVVDYLFHAISNILKSAEISYIKWDMNRHLTEVWSQSLPPEQQGEVAYRYVLGVYSLLERLLTEFPDLLIEGCSGGGGRFDAGMLYYTPQIWCSDNTDAIARIGIQYGTSFGYPVSSVGSHVSAVPNHQTFRTTSLHTRGIVAMSGTFGYELDISKLTKEEKSEIKEQIQTYQKHYDLIANGEYYRLSDPFAQNRYAAWMFVSSDQSQALLNVVCLQAECNGPLIRVKLRGLSEEKKYLINGEYSLSGAALMNVGLPVPYIARDYIAYQYEIRTEK